MLKTNKIYLYYKFAFVFSSQVWLSTAPTQPLTHWYQVRCLFIKPITVNQGQVMNGHVTLHSNRK